MPFFSTIFREAKTDESNAQSANAALLRARGASENAPPDLKADVSAAHDDLYESTYESVEEAEALSQKMRKKYGTVQGDRFPMPDKKHARLALQMLSRAKGLSSGDKAKIKARAHKMLGKSAAKESTTFGSSGIGLFTESFR